MILTIMYILRYLSWITDGIIICKILGGFLRLRNENTIVKLMLYILFFVSSGMSIYAEEVTGTIGVLSIFILTVALFYKGNWIIKMSAIIITYPIAIAISYVTEDIGFLIWYHLLEEKASDLVTMALSLIVVLIQVIIWYLIYRMTKKWLGQAVKELTTKMWVFIDAIALTSCVSIITIIYKSTILGSYIAYPVCFMCTFTSLVCCYLCTYISNSLKADMEIQSLKHQESYYKELEKNQDYIRKLRHDMKNHLNVIEIFLRDNEFEQAKEYFLKLSNKFNVNNYVFCSNNIVNAVLNTKYNYALQNGIECKFEIDIDNNIIIDPINLCSLFSNMLDNAIEACLKIEECEKRWIHLIARSYNNHFSCKISNAKRNHIRTSNGKLLTDKKNTFVHGIGIKNIKDIVLKYNGEIQIDFSEEEFVVIILI